MPSTLISIQIHSFVGANQYPNTTVRRGVKYAWPFFIFMHESVKLMPSTDFLILLISSFDKHCTYKQIDTSLTTHIKSTIFTFILLLQLNIWWS